MCWKSRLRKKWWDEESLNDDARWATEAGAKSKSPTSVREHASDKAAPPPASSSYKFTGHHLHCHLHTANRNCFQCCSQFPVFGADCFLRGECWYDSAEASKHDKVVTCWLRVSTVWHTQAKVFFARAHVSRACFLWYGDITCVDMVWSTVSVPRVTMEMKELWNVRFRQTTTRREIENHVFHNLFFRWRENKSDTQTLIYNFRHVKNESIFIKVLTHQHMRFLNFDDNLWQYLDKSTSHGDLLDFHQRPSLFKMKNTSETTRQCYPNWEVGSTHIFRILLTQRHKTLSAWFLSFLILLMTVFLCVRFVNLSRSSSHFWKRKRTIWRQKSWRRKL